MSGIKTIVDFFLTEPILGGLEFLQKNVPELKNDKDPSRQKKALVWVLRQAKLFNEGMDPAATTSKALNGTLGVTKVTGTGISVVHPFVVEGKFSNSIYEVARHFPCGAIQDDVVSMLMPWYNTPRDCTANDPMQPFSVFLFLSAFSGLRHSAFSTLQFNFSSRCKEDLDEHDRLLSANVEDTRVVVLNTAFGTPLKHKDVLTDHVLGKWVATSCAYLSFMEFIMKLGEKQGITVLDTGLLCEDVLKLRHMKPGVGEDSLLQKLMGRLSALFEVVMQDAGDDPDLGKSEGAGLYKAIYAARKCTQIRFSGMFMLSAIKTRWTRDDAASEWSREFKRITTYARKDSVVDAFDAIITVAERMDSLVLDWYEQCNYGIKKIVFHIEAMSIEDAYNTVSLATAAQMCNLMPRVMVNQFARVVAPEAVCCDHVSVSVCNVTHGVRVCMKGPLIGSG
eukprot:3940038-Rhodomonas_salina.1